VLVTLDATGDVVPPAVLDAARLAPKDWCFWFRLHPGSVSARLATARGLIDATGARHVDLAYVAQLPLFAVLRAVDVHVTATWSTVVKDAAAVGVPSVAGAAAAGELFADEVAAGVLALASTPAELTAAIDRQRLVHVRVPPSAGSRAEQALKRILTGARPGSPVRRPSRVRAGAYSPLH
jgi:hypothetical protein